LHYILNEIYIPVKMVRLIDMCLSETYSNVRVSKHLSDILPIQNGSKKENVFSPLLFNFVSEHCLSTAGRRPGTGPWHQLYRAASSPGICHFSFLSSFHG